MSSPSTSAASTPTVPVANATLPALKPINQTALQATVDTTAQELLVPGAVVLVRTPQGEFAATYGTS